MRVGVVLLLCLRAAAEECNPQDYKINIMNRRDPDLPDEGFYNTSVAYCSEHTEVRGGNWGEVLGWDAKMINESDTRPIVPGVFPYRMTPNKWANDRKDWGLPGIGGGCLSYNSWGYSCPCYTHGGSTSTPGSCGCAMKFDRHQGHCFQKTTPCQKCGRDAETGLFMRRVGCGCISCIAKTGAAATWDNAAARIALGWASDTKCSDRSNPRWHCGGGSCLACPAGHYCPPTNLYPLPCDKGFYQDAVGASVCKMCRCPAGKFVYDDNEAAHCDPITGIPPGRCLDCNQCTDAGRSKICAGFRDPAYGYWQQADSGGKKCRKCKLCQGLEYAAFPTGLSQFCVTDDEASGNCAERYGDVKKCEFGGTVPCPVIEGKMQWKSGYRRLPGRQYTPGLAAGNVGNADLGFLPYFEACPTLREGWRWRSESSDPDWDRDCEHQECNTAFYLASDGTCTPCPPGSSGGGGSATECTCNDGLASYTSLKTKFPLSYLPTAQRAVTCVDCMRDVYFVEGGNVQQEAVACGNNSITRAVGAQYVSAGRIRNCIEVALPNRTGCTTCPPGTSTTDERVCEPCKEGKYQDKAGQRSCKDKRTRCDAGQVMVSNSDDKASRLKDYACEPCPTECPPNQITVRAENMSSDVAACDGNGRSFYACYNGWGDGSGPHAPPGYRLQYKGEGSATMHTCGKDPPSYAAWVPFENAGTAGAECYFACIHGVNVSARSAYNAALVAHVRRYRRELIPFLVKPTASNSDAPKNVMLDSVWQYDEIGTDIPPDLSWTMPLQWDVASNVADASTNTFLHVGELSGGGVCMSPKTSYTAACPRGYQVRDAAGDVGGCALIARSSLLKISRKGLVAYAAISGSMQCITEAPSDLSTFQNRKHKCGIACLDARLAAANDALWYEMVPSDPWATRLLWMSLLLKPLYWKRPGTGFNPYIPVGCNETKCADGTFHWTTDTVVGAVGKRRGHSACVPCSDGPQICSLLSPPQFFRECGQNISSVCIECRPAYENGAALIPHTDKDYSDWLNKRNSWDYQNIDEWRKVQCRYYCPANYTSNLDPAMYNTRPCIPCQQVIQSRCRGVVGPSYVYDASISCGGMRNFWPYMPRCAECGANDVQGHFDFDPAAVAVVDGYAKCVGTCKPSIYHSLGLPARVLLPPGVMTEIGRIDCVLCSTMQSVACDGKCGDGHYRHEGGCLPCSTGRCQYGHYRELCPATADAKCVPCPLYPPPSEGVMIAHTNDTLNFTVKAVYSLHPHECPLRCANNYAWINRTSGLSPFPAVFDAAVFACVSCTKLSPNAVPLYSFWKEDCISNPNAMASSATEALKSMQRVAGGCCMCRLNHDVDSSSSALCELRAGFTTQMQAVSETVSIVLSAPPRRSATLDLNSWRRLLATGGGAMVVNAYRQPVLSNMDYFAVCDEEVSSDARRKCVATRGKEWELSRSAAQPQTSQLLSGACVAGTYKPTRGEGAPCYACPDGSSTTGPLYEGATGCACMPGYYAAGDACVACAAGTYRSPNSPDACVQCPALSATAGSGSAYCYCIDGAYNSYDDACVMCEAGFYCESGVRHQCPQNSVSAAGAKAREECVCGADYYYGTISKQCILRGATRTSTGGCVAGWTLKGGVCSSGCQSGTFLLQQTCTPCPPGTFSSTGDMVGQCMPCPSNTKNGSTSCNPTAAKEECPSGQYYGPQGCTACPLGTLSPPNSVGISSCKCPPGLQIVDTECRPCPKGTFSHTISSACSKCPPNFTTDAPGAKSLLECRRIR
jgi:hypothetical protein